MVAQCIVYSVHSQYSVYTLYIVYCTRWMCQCRVVNVGCIYGDVKVEVYMWGCKGGGVK